MNTHFRVGYDKIASLIPSDCRVLDLGCGDGMLLEKLQKEKNVAGYGVEISETGVSSCVERGIYCYQADIDEGLKDYRNDSFDFVILNQTLQNTKRPDYVLKEIMRIGRSCIISFPNFAHIRLRFELLIRGTMPKNEILPYEWYNSPNIHMLTIKDFRQYCKKKGYPITRESHFSLNQDGSLRENKILPNTLAQYGFFVLESI